MSSIKYPISVKSNKDRYAFLYRLEELLKLEHNSKGTEFREGKITEKEWEFFKDVGFNPRSQLISNEISKYRKLLREDKTSIAKLSDIVV